MRKWILLLGTHGAAGALGIYLLPILIAPPAPSAAAVGAAASQAVFKGVFRRDLGDSDFLHWGEGTVTVGSRVIALSGTLGPGPDYRLYLSPAFVETEADFKRLKPRMARVGEVKTFENFVVPVPAGVDVRDYDSRDRVVRNVQPVHHRGAVPVGAPAM